MASGSKGLHARPTALVLAGGAGTRLRAVVADRPKPLAEVAGRPFLSYVLDQLVDAGLRDAVICIGHLGEQIEAFYGDAYRSLRLYYSRENEPLGTAGALRLAMRWVDSDDVVVLNGDSHCGVELSEFLAWFERRSESAALVALDRDDLARFGQLRLDSGSRVRAFEEKGAMRGRGWINAGIYAFTSSLVRRWPTVPLSLEREVLPFLAADGGLPAWRAEAEFHDIGTPESFAVAQRAFAAERAGLLILDRDGTVIEEKHYLADPERVELIPGVADGLRELSARGYEIAIVTNQSGIGRGYYDEAAFEAVTARMLELLEREGVRVQAVFHCPHAPTEHCGCRKPEPGMFAAASEHLGFAAHECTVVGDKACDIDLGRAVGARTVLVRTGYGGDTEREGTCHPDFVVDCLGDLVGLEGTR
ncbi:MAG: HAD-IIIA family hydrolase [Planctomycetes bacterium]|nr:HAD-IIIA family hydrolase [Planctomycetota bacterium]